VNTVTFEKRKEVAWQELQNIERVRGMIK